MLGDWWKYGYEGYDSDAFVHSDDDDGVEQGDLCLVPQDDEDDDAGDIFAMPTDKFNPRGPPTLKYLTASYIASNKQTMLYADDVTNMLELMSSRSLFDPRHSGRASSDAASSVVEPSGSMRLSTRGKNVTVERNPRSSTSAGGSTPGSPCGGVRLAISSVVDLGSHSPSSSHSPGSATPGTYSFNVVTDDGVEDDDEAFFLLSGEGQEAVLTSLASSTAIGREGTGCADVVASESSTNQNEASRDAVGGTTSFSSRQAAGGRSSSSVGQKRYRGDDGDAGGEGDSN